MKKKKLRKLLKEEVQRQIQEILDPNRFCKNCTYFHYSPRVCSRLQVVVKKKAWCKYWEKG